tara:strand:- start:635 stop:1600 length:966 start_codon:yes stop_codon:yes gene_type:complete
MYHKILDIKSFLPNKGISLDQMSKSFDYKMEYLKNKIGFSFWPRLQDGEGVSEMAYQAAIKLKESNPDLFSKAKLLICVTQNPDYKFPTTANLLQDRLNLGKGMICFDINQGCSGYVVGLNSAAAIMSANNISYGILITTDAYSKVMDKSDAKTNPLFGDGATASLLINSSKPSFLSWEWGSDGSGSNSLIVKGAGSKYASKLPIGDYSLQMSGRDIFNFACKEIPLAIKKCLDKIELDINDIDYIILHQANKYIVEAIAKILKLPMDKCPFLLEEASNTISSTIPMALEKLKFKSKLKGKKVVLAGFGVGLSWGIACVQF